MNFIRQILGFEMMRWLIILTPLPVGNLEMFTLLSPNLRTITPNTNVKQEMKCLWKLWQHKLNYLFIVSLTQYFFHLNVSKIQNLFLPKYKLNVVRISVLYCASLQDRNPYNFWFIFWEKRWLHKLILKFIDLYQTT